MTHKMRMHLQEAEDLRRSGSIERTIRRSRGFMRCNDRNEKTRSGHSCHKMDQHSFLSNAELGSLGAILSAGCGGNNDEENLGFDYINDLWGWESPGTNKIYGLIGLYDGTSFVDITKTRKPIVLGFMEESGEINCYDGFWRDIKVVNDIAYIGAESKNSGIQVFNLTRLDSATRHKGFKRPTRGDVARFEPDNVLRTIGNSHNIIGFQEEGKVLVVGLGPSSDTTTCNPTRRETVAVLNVAADPFDPPIECLDLGRRLNRRNQPPYAQFNTYSGYVHDAQCFIYNGPDGKFIGVPLCIFFAETSIGIYDMDNQRMLSTFSYTNATYVHQGWVSTDHTALYVNDEMDEECQSGILEVCSSLNNPHVSPTTRIYDISSLEDIEEPREFVNTKAHPSIDHNLYVKGNHIYSANYEAGARVYEIQEDMGLKEVAHYDMTNDCDNIIHCADPFAGTWTHYPYSDLSTTIAGNGFYGLSVFHVRLDA